MAKTTKEEAVTQINDLQESLWTYQQAGFDMDDVPEILETLEDAIMFAKVLFFEYVNEEDDNDTEV